MAKGDQKHFTIGQLMLTIAAISLMIAVLANPGAVASATVIAGFLGVGVVVIALFVAAFDACMGVRCPHCGAWAMGRTSIASFRDRFYRCSSCQARCRRGFLRGWDDASGPEFDRIYSRKRPENPWTAPPGLEDEDLIFSKTHVNLLLNKKRRNPDPPDQTEGTHD